MILAKVPRAFILAGSVITFLIIYTQFYAGNEHSISRYTTSFGYPPDAHQIVSHLKEHNGSPNHSQPGESPDQNTAEKPIDKLGRPGAESTTATTTGSASAEAGDITKDYRFLLRGNALLNMTDRVHYTRKCIKPVFSKSVDRDQVAEIGHSLTNSSVEVDLSNTEAAPVQDCEEIRLEVPRPYPTDDLSHIIFGISTDLGRLNQSRSSFEHWLSGTGAKLIAVVTDFAKQPPTNITRIEQDFRDSGIDATFVKPLSADFTVSQNHFAVLVDLVNHSDDNTKWFGLIDDDTFMPDLWPLADALSTVDHTEDAYVGQLSEDFQAVRHFGFMAFGGAGAYFSAPLARKLAPKALKCIHEASSGEGDIIIRDCVYAHSKAKLTMLDGIWQQDMKDDVSGFFEAGIKPTVLHHWRSWYHEPMVEMALASKFCGDCFLQRFRFDQDTVFTSGYSIVTYPKGMHDVNLDLMEGTWAQAGRDYDFSVGPLRERLPKDRKKSYKLKHAEITAKGELRQLYVYMVDRPPKQEQPKEEKKPSVEELPPSEQHDEEEQLEEHAQQEGMPAAPPQGKRDAAIQPRELGVNGQLDEVIELIWQL